MKRAFVLVNLGTPTAPTPAAVRTFLKAFLSDPHVVPLWKPLWWLILNGIVLPFRPKAVAKLYQKIWTPAGSPLMVHSEQQAQALQQRFPNDTVILTMRYGEPNLETCLKKLNTLDYDSIHLVPLYPQYSNSTTLTIIEQATTLVDPDKLSITPCFYDHPLYIDALVGKIKHHWQTQGRGDCLIFSFHSLPVSMIKHGDAYLSHCKITTQLIVDKLKLTPEDYRLVFQSKIGRQKWLEPGCAQTLLTLPKQGIKTVDIICPGFVVDCLETLEEIAIANKKLFLNAGGKDYRYITALNEDKTFIDMLVALVD